MRLRKDARHILRVVMPCAVILGVACRDKSRGMSATVAADPHSALAQTPGAACPASRIALRDWKRVTAKNAELSLILPPNASPADVTPSTGRGETWLAGGLTIFYRVRDHRSDTETPSPNVQDYRECTENISGKPARIVTYSSAFGTISPGAFAEATWSLGDGRDLTLFTQSARIPGASDTLFAVLRSVSLRK